MKKIYAGRYAWVIAATGLAVTALFATVAAPAGAQAAPSTMTAQQAIHDLKANYGIMIIPRNGVDLNTLVNGSVVSSPAEGPTQAMTRLASAMDARSKTVFIVVPASADRPVTTLSDAQAFDTSGGIVTLHLSGLPAQDAIQAVASANNATADIRSDIGTRSVNLDGTNMSVAEAIAQIAAQTNTHWIQAYELVPPPAATLARAPQFHRGPSYTFISQDLGPTGPVYFHPAPPPAPPAAQPAPTDQGNANNQPADQSNQAQNPNANGYPPYFVMQNGYGYVNGMPYPQTYSGFSNGGFSTGGLVVPGGSLYYPPGFGGGPFVFGGSSTTTPF